MGERVDPEVYKLDKMATETYFSNSTKISSEEVYDYICTVCAQQKKNTEASKFCLECQEYLCSGCIEWHKKFPLMAGHVLEKAAELTRRVKPFGKHIPTEQCPKHPAEIIKMYCAIHDKVACTVCTTIDHKACSDIHYIPDVADTLYTKQMKTDTITAVLKASEKMETLKEIFNKALDDLNTAKQTTLQEIQEFRQELNDMFDKLEQNTKQQLNDQYKTLQAQWQVIIEEGTAVAHNLQKQLDQLQNTECNTSQQFILTKVINENISLADVMSSQSVPSSIQMTFSKCQAIKTCFEQLLSLGDVSHSIDNRKLGLYKVKDSHKYNVRIKSDSGTCRINGACVLDSGTLLLADYNNKKLKLFDTIKNAVTSDCTMPDLPIAVCLVSDVEAAVGVTNNMIQFVSISNGLLPTKTLTMEHCCCGLDIAVDKMYITDCDNLYIHELNGKLLRTINKDRSGQKILSSASHLTVSNNGNIHLTDLMNGLITLDTQGQVLWKYCGFDIDSVCGVCTDGCGNVFVCGYGSHNVLQIGHDGRRMGELVNKILDKFNPVSVSFDQKNCKLVITSLLNDNILVFSLK